MRFSTATSITLVLFFALVSVVIAGPAISQNNDMMYSEIIEEEMYRHYLMRRADASAATPSASSTTSGPGAAAATTAAPVKKPKAPFTLAAPAILQDGTLFYIAVAVTTLLWGTGKAIDIKTERQERYAESLVNSI